jgi:hypothetical protein
VQKILGILLLAGFLLINVASSQFISPLYYGLVDENKTSAIAYLRKIGSLPMFDKELDKYINIYGSGLFDEVFFKEKALETKIKYFEQIYQKNSNSRDIAYSLYQLYMEKGDEKTAEKYLKQAKIIDPIIN